MVPIEGTRDFYIGKYEVTNEEYREFLRDGSGSEPSSLQKEEFSGRRQPVAGVNYDDACNYCMWLSEKTGKSYRLPTVQEWKKAAFGESDQYPWGGSDVPSPNPANFNNGNGTTVDVEGSGPGKYGPFGMGGNVAELCDAGRNDGSVIALGGSWRDPLSFLHHSSKGHECRRAERRPYVGFRVARDPEQ